MKKILLITTIALFSVYAQPAYSADLDLESEYDSGDFNLVEPDIKDYGDATTEDSGITIVDGTQTDPGNSDDTGEENGTPITEPIISGGGTNPGNFEIGDGTEDMGESEITEMGCEKVPSCLALGFTSTDCTGKKNLDCAYGPGTFCSTPPTTNPICDKDKEYVEYDQTCRPYCPANSVRENNTCKCSLENNVYNLVSNTCVCDTAQGLVYNLETNECTSGNSYCNSNDAEYLVHNKQANSKDAIKDVFDQSVPYGAGYCSACAEDEYLSDQIIKKTIRRFTLVGEDGVKNCHKGYLYCEFQKVGVDGGTLALANTGFVGQFVGTDPSGTPICQACGTGQMYVDTSAYRKCVDGKTYCGDKKSLTPKYNDTKKKCEACPVDATFVKASYECECNDGNAVLYNIGDGDKCYCGASYVKDENNACVDGLTYCNGLGKQFVKTQIGSNVYKNYCRDCTYGLGQNNVCKSCDTTVACAAGAYYSGTGSVCKIGLCTPAVEAFVILGEKTDTSGGLATMWKTYYVASTLPGNVQGGDTSAGGGLNGMYNGAVHGACSGSSLPTLEQAKIYGNKRGGCIVAQNYQLYVSEADAVVSMTNTSTTVNNIPSGDPLENCVNRAGKFEFTAACVTTKKITIAASVK